MILPKVIYEDENLLVLDKPSGLVVHSNGKTNEYTVASFVKERNKEMFLCMAEDMVTDDVIVIELFWKHISRDTREYSFTIFRVKKIFLNLHM